MAKIFLLQQSTFHQGNFGDLERGETLTLGAFTTNKLATIALESLLPFPIFEAQFGSATCKCFITPINLDTKTKIKQFKVK